MPYLSRRLTILVVLAGVLAWAYWPTLGEIVEGWSTKPIYSHGYFVPLFSLFLLWQRRKVLAAGRPEPSWMGLPLIALAVAMHLGGAYLYYDWFGAASLLLLLAGMSLTLGGISAFRWAWPAIAFLFFMLPLPYRVEVALGFPLQRLATSASTYALQTLGFAAISEGNIIIMEEARIGVVEACNGLGMLMTFFALTTAVTILLRRPLIDKLVIFLSAVPIALFANVIRITGTGIVAETLGREVADAFFHGLAGLLMMPVALALLGIELKVLSWLVIELPAEERLNFGLTGLKRERLVGAEKPEKEMAHVSTV